MNVGKVAMAEDFLALENSSGHVVQDRREKIKHLLIGSPAIVRRTIQLLHTKGYSEVGEWSKPVAAGSLGSKEGDVIAILLRIVSVD